MRWLPDCTEPSPETAVHTTARKGGGWSYFKGREPREHTSAQWQHAGTCHGNPVQTPEFQSLACADPRDTWVVPGLFCPLNTHSA